MKTSIKNIILTVFSMSIVVNANDFSSCEINKEFSNGFSIEYGNVVTDYTKGEATERLGAVIDYVAETTVLKSSVEGVSGNGLAYSFCSDEKIQYRSAAIKYCTDKGYEAVSIYDSSALEVDGVPACASGYTWASDYSGAHYEYHWTDGDTGYSGFVGYDPNSDFWKSFYESKESIIGKYRVSKKYDDYPSWAYVRCTIPEPYDNVNNCPSGYTKDNSGNCQKAVTYSYYEYTCPLNYEITDNGYSTFSKSDPNLLLNNQSLLNNNVNNSSPPSKNCKKDVEYKFYSYECNDDTNIQGFSWSPIVAGYTSFIKTDLNIDIENQNILDDDVNAILAPSNNCERNYQQCTIQCPSGMTLDVANKVCKMSYEKDCSLQGLMYDSVSGKCVEATNCSNGSYPDAEVGACTLVPNCSFVNGACIELPNYECIDSYNYSAVSNACVKPIDCLNSQVASLNSEYCQSIPICDTGDLQISSECIKYIDTDPVICDEYERIGNTCFVKTSGEDVLVEKKPLIKHDVNSVGLSPEVFGNYTNADCFGDSCDDAISIIETNEQLICFEKKDGSRNCSEVIGCSFSGSVSTPNYFTAIWTDGKSLSLQDENGSIYEDAIQTSCDLHGLVGYKGRKYPISGMKSNNEEMEFWSAYGGEGYLGKIKFLRSIEQNDIELGYVYEDERLLNMITDGFGLIESSNSSTYAISKETMTSEKCDDMAQKHGFSIHPKIVETPSTNREAYDIVMNTTGGSFSDNDFVRTYEIFATCGDNLFFDYGSRECKADEIVGQPTCLSYLYYNQKYQDCASDPICPIGYDYDFDARKCFDEQQTTSLLCNNSDYFDYNTTSKLCENTVLSTTSYPYCETGYVSDFELNICIAEVTPTCTDSLTYNSLNGRCDVPITDSVPTCEEQFNFDTNIGRCVEIPELREPICPTEAIDKINGICYIPYPPAEHDRCVLVRYGSTIDFDDVDWAIKTEHLDNIVYKCSPLTCASADNSCQLASCRNSFAGNIISPTRTAPLAIECIDDECDANLPYYDWCGKDVGCPIELDGVQQLGSDCYKVNCVEGGYDKSSGKCYKWQCPKGYIQVGESCVEN